MFYLIIFWFGLGFIIGMLGMAIIIGLGISQLSKEGRLFYKDDTGKWIPKKPPFNLPPLVKE